MRRKQIYLLAGALLLGTMGSMMTAQAEDAADEIVLGCGYVADNTNPVDSAWDLTSHGISEGIFMQDAEGNLVATGKNAYAYAYTEYAPDGMSYDVSFVGVDGNPTSNGAYWIHRYYLDEEGHKVEEQYLDEEEKLVDNADGYARIFRQYDENGNCVYVAYAAVGDNAFQEKNGYTATERAFDDEGNIVKTMTSDGGIALWDGCDANGMRMSTGFYSVYASQGETTTSGEPLTKIAIIKTQIYFNNICATLTKQLPIIGSCFSILGKKR